MKHRKIIGTFSEAAIKRYLADRAFEKRGLTRAQYIARCRKAWNKIKYDPEFERKVIVDFLQPVTTAHLFGLDNLEVDFIDTAITELPMRGFEHKSDIECIVFFAGPAPDQSGRTGPVRIKEMFVPDMENPEPETMDEQNYFVALFDVLGFSALVAKMGSAALLRTYQDLIEKAVLNTNYTGFGRVKVGKNQYGLGAFYAPVRYAYFSDTIMLWTTNRFTYVAPFLAKCADLICEALKIGMPLRGSISYGSAVMNKATNTFIGKAVVEASAIEKNQRWIGATFGVCFMLNSVREALSETLIVPLFCQHFKPEMPVTFPYLTLDWVTRWKGQNNPDLVPLLETLREKAPEKNKDYYDNTIDFISYVDLHRFEDRAVFLRATNYHVRNLDTVHLDKLPPDHPVILKVKGEVPICGHIINFPEELWTANAEMKELLRRTILFVRLMDYSKFLASLPNTPNTTFDLTASGVVLQIEKRNVESIDLFNYDPKEEPTERMINFEVIR